MITTNERTKGERRRDTGSGIIFRRATWMAPFFYFVSDDDGGGGRCVFEQGGSKQGARLCECRKMTSVERRTSSKSSCEKRN